ncbi:MAG: hypothetical protein AB1817_20670 [Chloroflexota bacterium]
MAITTTDLKRMQRDIEQLKKRVARLQRRDNSKRRGAVKKQSTVTRPQRGK